MIEPVHYGSSSILKMRFLGHPVLTVMLNLKVKSTEGEGSPSPRHKMTLEELGLPPMNYVEFR